RATALRAARNYRETQCRLGAAEAELALFPEGVGKVRGDEPQAIDRLKRELREAEAARDRARSEAEGWEKVRGECRLGEEGVPDEVLKTLAERRQRLNTLRAALDAQSRQRAGAAEAREKARAAVSPAASEIGRAHV